ncbi:hypothetical protein [Streptosporangium sp. KLBMP 9127]|nr:hypothetical protein [Streptosporangium sp. KLBMP 9127]
MASDRHEDIRDFLQQAAKGSMPTGKRMVFNVTTGKWEVRSNSERPGDTLQQIDPEDMRAFAR